MKLFYRLIENSYNSSYDNLEVMLYSSPHYSDYIGSLTMQKNKDSGDWNVQPNEIISLLDAKEIYLFKDVFVQVADKGKYLYKVMQDNELYKYIICANDIIASKQIKAGYELGARYLIE